MPTRDEWERALVTPQKIVVESSPALIKGVRTLQAKVDAERIKQNKPVVLRKPKLTTLSQFTPEKSVTIQPAYLLQRLGVVTTPPEPNLADVCSYWAHLRYLWAFQIPDAAGANLRLSDLARDIDFHQKGLLSDQIGVGMAALLMSDHLNAPHAADVDVALKQPMWQVGKADDFLTSPDYLFSNDSKSKLYVVECKGTQTTRANSLKQMRRGMEQVPALKFKKRRQPPSIVIATCLSLNETRVLVLDPPGEDRPERDDTRVARRVSHREWQVGDDRRFVEVSRLLSEAKLLAYAGGDEVAAAKVARANIERPRTPWSVPRTQEVSENKFGRFIGVRQRVGMSDPARVEIYQGIENDSYNALVTEDQARKSEVLRRFRQRMRKRRHANEGRSPIAVDRNGASVTIRVAGPDGSIMEIRITAP